MTFLQKFQKKINLLLIFDFFCDIILTLNDFYKVISTYKRRIYMRIALGIILLVAALFLIIAVLLQNGKSKGLSGTISGGAETFFGKNKGKTIDKKLSVITTVVAIVFVVITLVVFVAQDYVDIQKQANDYWSSIIESINNSKDSSSSETSSDVDTATGTSTDSAVDTSTGTDTSAG